MQRARHLLHVVRRLAHAHEHHIPQRRHAVLPDGGGGGVQLREDLVGGEGAE